MSWTALLQSLDLELLAKVIRFAGGYLPRGPVLVSQLARGPLADCCGTFPPTRTRSKTWLGPRSDGQLERSCDDSCRTSTKSCRPNPTSSNRGSSLKEFSGNRSPVYSTDDLETRDEIRKSLSSFEGRAARSVHPDRIESSGNSFSVTAPRGRHDKRFKP